MNNEIGKMEPSNPQFVHIMDSLKLDLSLYKDLMNSAKTKQYLWESLLITLSVAIMGYTISSEEGITTKLSFLNYIFIINVYIFIIARIYFEYLYSVRYGTSIHFISEAINPRLENCNPYTQEWYNYAVKTQNDMFKMNSNKQGSITLFNLASKISGLLMVLSFLGGLVC